MYNVSCSQNQGGIGGGVLGGYKGPGSGKGGLFGGGVSVHVSCSQNQGSLRGGGVEWDKCTYTVRQTAVIRARLGGVVKE